jgi:hypothetical protein
VFLFGVIPMIDINLFKFFIEDALLFYFFLETDSSHFNIIEFFISLQNGEIYCTLSLFTLSSSVLPFCAIASSIFGNFTEKISVHKMADVASAIASAE